MRRKISSSSLIGPPSPPNPAPNSLFVQSHLKAYWAAFHTYWLSQTWAAHLRQSNLMALVPNEKGSMVLQTHIGVPVEVSMGAADAIHALRSALDYLVATLARKAGVSDERILFPFSKTKERFEEGLEAPAAGKRLQGRAKDFQELLGHYPKLKPLLKNRIKPYPKRGDGDLGTRSTSLRIPTTSTSTVCKPLHPNYAHWRGRS